MKVRLMIIIGVISFLLGGCNKIQKNSNQVQLVQRTEEILVESEDLADDYFHIYKERWNQSNRNLLIDRYMKLYGEKNISVMKEMLPHI